MPVRTGPIPAPRFAADPTLPHIERIEAAFEDRKDFVDVAAANIRPDSLQVVNKPLHRATAAVDLAVRHASLTGTNRVSYFVTGNDASGKLAPATLMTFTKDASNYWKFASIGTGRNLDTVFAAYKTYSVAHPNAKITLVEGFPGTPSGFLQAIMLDKPNRVEILETPASAFPHTPPNPAYPIRQGDQMTREQLELHLQTIAKL
jgi:hypothetical protein